jgi:hypothetical protein
MKGIIKFFDDCWGEAEVTTDSLHSKMATLRFFLFSIAVNLFICWPAYLVFRLRKKI